MKPAAEDATEILVSYLRLAAKGRDLSSSDTFAEIEFVNHPINSVRLLVKAVIAQFVLHIQQDQDAARHAHG